MGEVDGGGRRGGTVWLKDKFGLSWQIVPKMLERLGEEEGGKSGRVLRAIMGMKKIIITDLQAAYDAE